MEELWKKIEGFEMYEVSNFGMVRNIITNYILKQQISKKGYFTVGLFKNKKQHIKVVHRLVALAFIPKIEGKDQVNHIDENKKNNHVLNLEWMSAKENSNHGTRNERMGNSLKGRKYTYEQRLNIAKGRGWGKEFFVYNVVTLEFIGSWVLKSQCERDLGISRNSIYPCLKGICKSCSGYIFSYEKLH